MNVFILLAAGHSTRYSTGLKQFAKVTTHGRQQIVLECSLNAAYEAGIDKVVIVVNAQCMADMATVRLPPFTHGVSIVVADPIITSREQSIRKAFEVVAAATAAAVPMHGIIIHDAARPFITAAHIKAFMDLPATIKYAQYYMRITGGLMCMAASAAIPQFVNRDDYVETCTPLYIRYELGKKILEDSTSVPEFFTALPPVVTMNPQAYIFIEGEPAYLRKITYASDVA